MNENPEVLLNQPVQHLKGIGKAKTALFRRLGIITVRDVINHYPRDYEDRSKLKKISELLDGESCSFEGIIVSKVVESRPRRGLLISRVSIKDETGLINGIWFNQPYLKNTFKVGEKYIFYGTITRKRSFEILSPVYEKISENKPVNTCRIVPIYPATAKLSQNAIRAAIRNALLSTQGKHEDILPQWIRDRYGLADKDYAVNNIHFPESNEAFIIARNRLVFEELFMLQLGLLIYKSISAQKGKGIKFASGPYLKEFLEKLPFKLTNAQLRVLSEIESDMEQDKVMNRLIQGDVGSGKTVVAVLALLKVVKSGYQGALMAPTGILAEQHYNSIELMVKPLGIKVSLLTGNTPAKEALSILSQLKEGKVDIIIGTHALLEERVIFKNLGLVVTDEQHRFGVRQRAKLSNKGENPDILVMTATPIPRTLSLILYGDLDISIIDELPPGRKKVETYVVDSAMRDRINRFIRKQISLGRQVYIVCPLVEQSDSVKAKSALETADVLANKTFYDLRVALVHGKMKASEKEEIMARFAKGDIDILVSTTVIEVGVNVPNASLMVVENAERFGLSQLHQLRGRVGRGEYQSYCILFNESGSAVARERMKVMEQTNDGFLISEKDLELRGPGDFFGTRQHGIPELKIANLYKDIEILKKAQEAAFELISSDALLEKDENVLLGKAINDKFKASAQALSMN